MTEFVWLLVGAISLILHRTVLKWNEAEVFIRRKGGIKQFKNDINTLSLKTLFIGLGYIAFGGVTATAFLFFCLMGIMLGSGNSKVTDVFNKGCMGKPVLNKRLFGKDIL